MDVLTVMMQGQQSECKCQSAQGQHTNSDGRRTTNENQLNLIQEATNLNKLLIPQSFPQPEYFPCGADLFHKMCTSLGKVCNVQGVQRAILNNNAKR